MTDRLAIGGNSPPRHEAFAMALEDVRLEAGNYLDGQQIETQGQADAVGIILSRARQIKKDADEARKQDKEPHLIAGRKVDADYKPVLESCDNIMCAAQRPLTDFLARKQAEQIAAAEKARQEAAERQQEAIAASRAAEGDIEATERARELEKAAEAATKLAGKAGRAKAHVAGEGRAVGLRSYWTHQLTHRRELLEWIMRNDPDGLTDMLNEYARKAVAGGTRHLPGVVITQQQRAA